ncbi:MAG: DUF3783 domain-containing protein [Clostridium sp.]|nr:DUF3783 domain-containing protein [Clostridium sp.]MDY3828447.1 DUF3783 domain-containing protein [Clostridium sp.]
MLNNNKCILVYNISEEEYKALGIFNTRIIVVTKEMLKMKVSDAILGLNIPIYNNLDIEEKVILFNNYADEELQVTIKLLRTFITGGILAVVTPTSSKWTFEYLIKHLIAERKFVSGK